MRDRRWLKKVLCVFAMALACVLAKDTGVQAAESLARPVIQSVKLKGDNGFTVRWKKVEGATGYEIYGKPSGGTLKKIGKTNAKTRVFVQKDLQINKKYYYKVRAVRKAKGTTKYSKMSKAASNKTKNIKVIALTFDDGPGPYTNQLLDILEKNQVKATFFMVGENISRYPKVVKRMGKLGCEYGNHSWNHANLANLSAKDIKTQINKTDNALKKVTGKTTTILRPPYGSVSQTLRKTAGKPLILWSVDTLDWKYRNSSRVQNHVLSHAQNGSIILMHDIHKTTVQAMKQAIPQLKKKGYRFVTVSEMAAMRGIDMKKGEKYFSFYP